LSQAQVVTGFLPVAHQQPTTPGEPGQRAFHDPPAGRIALLPVGLEPFLSDAPDMRRLVVGDDGLMARRLVVALVQTEVLGCLCRGLGLPQHNGLEGGGQALGCEGFGFPYL
jgi:hypothetical protein